MSELHDPETFPHPRLPQIPVISRVDDTLWFGGVCENLLLPERFLHVISLYPAVGYHVVHGLKTMLFASMHDIAELPPVPMLHGLATWVNACRQDGPTLVHCEGGLNRSGMIVALALIEAGEAPVAAVAKLRAARSQDVLFNDTFRRFVLSAEATGLEPARPFGRTA